MKKLMVLLVALSSFIVMVHAEDIVMSWSSNGVVMAAGMVVGSTCTVEWVTTLDQTFTNATETIVFNDMVADSNGMIQLGIPMYFRVRGTSIPVSPDGMVSIPGGTNNGTNPLATGESYDEYYPETYSSTVDSFYMDATEVTKAQWDIVYNWAITNDYSFDNTGLGKVSDHPVQTVNWYDCVKWCNARSELDGRTACYTVDGSVYKTGQSSPDCDFDVDGYRLPTNDEWEYAARGGLSSKRFPWGDTIGNTNANYFSSTDYDYDIGSIRGYNPDYDDAPIPYTSPVGSFAANGYGLYDMAGNVSEWCNTASGSYRCIRGGSWPGRARYLRCGCVYWYALHSIYHDFGFRSVCR
jgi:formylglycine-generating enzyme required for sulfatase activity